MRFWKKSPGALTVITFFHFKCWQFIEKKADMENKHNSSECETILYNHAAFPASRFTKKHEKMFLNQIDKRVKLSNYIESAETILDNSDV